MILLNGTKLDFETFPNGETRVNGEQIHKLLYGLNYLTLKYEDDSDFIKLMFAKRHLDEFNTRTKLIIKYMPYSRMDRVEGKSVFTLKYVADFINNLNFEKVAIIEPHSDVSAAVVNRSTPVYPTFELIDKVVKVVGFSNESDYLFFPDGGAAKRYSKVKGYKNLIGHKERDFTTGQIKNLQVIGDVSKANFKALIVDDLCSYGGTFIKSAEALRAIGATEIYLLVAHCEESIHQGDLLKTDLIKHVFTTDSILENTHPKITIYPL